MLKRNISLVLLSEIHRDPLKPKAEREEIERLVRQGKPVVYCDEDFSGQTLENKLQGNTQILQMNSQFFMRINGLMASLRNRSDLYYRYFLLSDLPKIQVLLKNAGLSEYTVIRGSIYLSRHAHYEESLKLTEALIKLKVPYLGIDAEDKEQERLLGNTFFADEPLRIKTMTANIINHALPKLDKGGIVIVNIGVNHLKNLAASIAAQYKENPLLFEKYAIKIFPLKLFSPYIEDAIDNHRKTEPMGKLAGSAYFKEAYQALDCVEIFYSEQLKDKGRQRLTKTFDEAISYTSNQKTAPDFPELKISSTIKKIKETLIEPSMKNHIQLKYMMWGCEPPVFLVNSTQQDTSPDFAHNLKIQ